MEWAQLRKQRSTTPSPQRRIPLGFEFEKKRKIVDVMKTRTINTPNGAIAVRESEGRGPAAVLIHGNSSSSRAFSRQVDGPLGERFRLVAVDLPGHGASDHARDPSAYSLPGHARAVRTVVDALGLSAARFVGWSLGGHLALEMAPDLPHARGFMIFGAPPLAFPPAMADAFLPHPAARVGFSERIDRDEAAAYVASFFKPGFADVPPFFLEDVLRADGCARSLLGASIAPGGYRDEATVVRDLEAPLAVLHGSEEQLVNGAYFASIVMPTLWRGAVQTIPGAGHAPQWETARAFDALLEAFMAETQ
jgi:pimeloyl-ACP methyl ester carboxylesterase